jgi:thymidylate kinase
MDIFKTKIIELLGLPKNGKTTTSIALSEYLKSKGFKVEIAKERASICPIKDKLHPSFNFWTANSFIKEYIEANDNGIEFLIADRGIFDSYVWVNLLSKKINERNFIYSFENILKQDYIFSNYFMTFYFHCEVEECLKRAKVQEIKFSPGRIMNFHLLNEYLLSFNEIKASLKIIAPIIEIDTSNTPITNVLEFVSKSIEQKISKDFKLRK